MSAANPDPQAPVVDPQNEDFMTCRYPGPKRPRYFRGMLLSERDFQDEQNYHIGKRKMLNRELHGWGIVCGFEIELLTEKDDQGEDVIKSFSIHPGLALDRHGNEIWLNEKLTLKVEDICARLNEQFDSNKNQQDVYVSICWQEEKSKPVPVYERSDCDDETIAPSRCTDGFCVRVTTEAPSHLDNEFGWNLPSCPDDGSLDPTIDPTKGECGGSLMELFNRIAIVSQGKEKVDPISWLFEMDINDAQKSTMQTKLDELFCKKSLPCSEQPSNEDCLVLCKFSIDSAEKTIVNNSADCYSMRSYVFGARMWRYVITSLLRKFQKIDSQGNAGDDLRTDNPIEVLCWILKRLINITPIFGSGQIAQGKPSESAENVLKKAVKDVTDKLPKPAKIKSLETQLKNQKKEMDELRITVAELQVKLK